MSDPNKSKTVGHIWVDPRREAYTWFFDSEWSQRIIKVASASRMEAPVDSLCMNWSAIASTHRLPALIIDIAKANALGIMEDDPSLTQKIMATLKAQLPQQMGESMTRRQRQRLSATIDRIADNVIQSDREFKRRFAGGDEWGNLLWDRLVQSPQFNLALAALLRLCYTGIYFAYEEFLRESLTILTGKPMMRDDATGGELRNAIHRELGEQVTLRCVEHREVLIARFARNALSHSGGKINKDLSTLNHGFRVIDGKLQITPNETVTLYNFLKDCALYFLEKAILDKRAQS